MKYILIIAVLIVIAIMFETISPKQVCINNKCFKVEVVESIEEQKKGLMLRQDLPLDSGMLFTYNQEQNLSFWMKNMLIPLDIIWINKDKEVVHIERDVQPCQEEKCESITFKATYVLEVNAGQAEGIKLGDKVNF